VFPALKQNLGGHIFEDDCEVKIDMMTDDAGHGLLSAEYRKVYLIIL
jgi:hypothetical protein